MSKTITLPLPSRNLSPNSQVHWSIKAKNRKSARRDAALLAFHQCGPQQFTGYRLDFYWPVKRRRDRDNACASAKSALDGIADAMRQDDSEWEFYGVRFSIDSENPRLEIVFSEIE